MPPAPPPGVPGPSAVYRVAAGTAFGLMRLQRWRFSVRGLEHVPRRGGAVLAANHHGYWDFFAAGRPPYQAYGRPIRILAKESLFRAPLFGWLMRQAEHIPVHRGEGRGAFDSAIAALRSGELILVLPEQTISRSFELLPFKTGAVRLAAAAGVPLIPAVTWGTHRFHTEGRPLRPRWRLPVSVRYGAALHCDPDRDPRHATDELRRRMATMLDEAVRAYPDGTPAGAWWVPRRFGGGAPDHGEAQRLHERKQHRWGGRREVG